MAGSKTEEFAEFFGRVGKELKAAREASGLTLQAVADVLGWERSAVNKIETGITNLALIDYLNMVRLYKVEMPTHPALALANHYFPLRTARKPK